MENYKQTSGECSYHTPIRALFSTVKLPYSKLVSKEFDFVYVLVFKFFYIRVNKE
jgi:hypothetical protein